MLINKNIEKNSNPNNLHNKIITQLQSFNLNNLTNIIIHGPTGAGKSTLFYILMKHLFKLNEIKKVHRHLKLPSLEITYMESCNNLSNSIYNTDKNTQNHNPNNIKSNWVEIMPSDYGLKDKIVVIEFIKEIVSNKSITTFFQPNKSLNNNVANYKIIVIHSAELITESAMAALRRTVEQHAKTIRFIMITNNINKIMKPIRSRAFCLFVPAPDDNIVLKFLTTTINNESIIPEHKSIYSSSVINNKNSESIIPEPEPNSIISSSSVINNKNSETKTLDINIINQIIKTSSGNLHKVFYKIEKFSKNLTTSFNKNILLMDYELELNDLCIKIIKSPIPYTVLAARKIFYSLLSNQVLSNTIFDALLNFFLDYSENNKNKLSVKQLLKLYVIYKDRAENTNNEIIHLEAFILGIMCLI
ncbi:Replication factor C subunit 5 [Cucumispora dikerogammari]|nr:Replication factor C subunit 5 [Cucumispora dikerogammari]